MAPTGCRILVVLLMSACLTSSAGAEQARGNERPLIGLHVDEQSPNEKTLAARIAAVEGVLVVRIIGNGQGRAQAIPDALLGPFAGRPGVDPPPFVFTEYAFEIVDVIKPSPAAGITGTTGIFVVQGGEATWKDRPVMSVGGPPPLRAGGRYVIMIKSRGLGAPLSVGASDILSLNGDRLSAHGGSANSDYAKELRGLPVADAVRALRMAADEAAASPQR